MKNSSYKKRRFLFVLTAILSTVVSISAQSTGFSYQGRLSSGGNPASGTYEMQFQLFDSLNGGAQVGATFTEPNVAVVNGVFTTTLDFGAAAFDGSPRFLETGVRALGSPDPFTILSPRQAINSTPYAIQAKNASQLGGIDAKQFLQTSGSGSGLTGVVKSVNTLTGDVAIAAGTNITITPEGSTLTIASTSGGVGGSGATNSIPFWSNGTTLGTSQITQSANGVQLPNGVQMAVGAQGYQVSLGSPNGETGLSIAGPAASSRADLRFDGVNNKLRLVVGPAGGPPINGISIDTSGNVGIRTTTPLSVLDIGATGDGAELLRFSTERPWIFKQIRTGPSAGLQLFSTSGSKKFEITTNDGFNVATFLAESNTSRVGIGTTDPIAKLHVENGEAGKSAVFGRETGTSGVGTYGEATASSGVGVFARNLNGIALYADGNAAQSRDKGGLLKAMALIRVVHTGSNATSTASVLRCYNSITNSSSGNCGFTFGTVFGSFGVQINFGFQVNDRFISITGNSQNGAGVVTSYPNSTTVEVLDGSGTTEFFIFIY